MYLQSIQRKQLLCQGIFISFLFLFTLLFSTFNPTCSFANPGVVDYLYERGLYFYENADYANALREFKKVLLIQPEHESALDYIDLIEQKQGVGLREEKKAEELEKVEVDEEEEKVTLERKSAIMKALQEAKEIVTEEAEVVEKESGKEVEEEVPPLPSRKIEARKIAPKTVFKKKPANILILDEEVRATQPDTLIELEMGKSLLIAGRQINRFLVTVPKMIEVERKSSDEIELKPLRRGSTFLHIWDSLGRWTFKIQNIPTQPEGLSLEELELQKMRRAENFKLRYSSTRDSYYLGPRLQDLEEETITFNQTVGLDGETPYGRFDSSARIDSLDDDTDLTYLTIGLTDGHIGRLEDFDLRGFDYRMYGSELAFPGINLRGLRFEQRLASPEMNYTLFWGREGQGTFGRLSPGLGESKDSFLEGGRFSLQPFDNFDYQLGYYHGHGTERDVSLRNDSIDMTANLDFEKWKLSAQGGYDTEKFAYLLNSVFLVPGLKIRTEYRDIYPEYLTIIGRPSRSGERGGLCLLEFSGIDKLFLSQKVDVYRDRLYPNPEKPDMWNVELNSFADYRISENTTLNANFRYWDEKGKIFPRRERSIGGGINQRMSFLKKNDLTIYSNYQYQQSKNFNSIISDYKRHRLIGGARFSLFEGLFTFASQEYSWLEEASPEEHFHPRAWETGFDYNQQIGKIPLYASARAYYRDEKDNLGTHSFLAGEDSVEFQGELSYRPSADWEMFLDGRLRRVWPEDATRDTYAEGEFITGARILFDTGIDWNPTGHIYGVVFKDLNGDGLRQEDEPGIKGVEVVLGREKSSVTDEDGGFIFTEIRAKKVYLNLELSSAPEGFVPSTAVLQEVSIQHNDISVANFGLTVRSEIIGTVFIDKNGNNKFDPDEQGMRDVILSLEDGSEARSNEKGRFYFRKVSPGKHILSVDVNTIPIHLLPKVPIKKELILDEGMSYIYNIALEALE